MQCLTPVTVKPRRLAPPDYTDSNGRHPKYIYGDSVQVPCGRCFACTSRLSLEWYFRLYQELKEHDGYALFITLTYRDECLPLTKDNKPKLCKTDVQKFFKLLRKWFIFNPVVQLQSPSNVLAFGRVQPLRYNDGSKITKIRYVLMGEYGPSTHRPHYHAIVFGFESWRRFFGNTPDTVSTTPFGRDFVNFVQSKCWRFGNVTVSPVNNGRLRYVSKNHVINYALDRSEKVFLTSRRPGIGQCFLTEDVAAWLYDNISLFVSSEDGTHYPVPRFYRNKIADDNYSELRRLKCAPFIESFQQALRSLTQSQLESLIRVYEARRDYFVLKKRKN